MTVKELYEYAKRNNAENYPLEVTFTGEDDIGGILYETPFKKSNIVIADSKDFPLKVVIDFDFN